MIYTCDCSIRMAIIFFFRVSGMKIVLERAELYLCCFFCYSAHLALHTTEETGCSYSKDSSDWLYQSNHPSQWNNTRNNVWLHIYTSVFRKVTTDRTCNSCPLYCLSSLNHDGLVAVQRYPIQIIYVGKEDGKTCHGSLK